MILKVHATHSVQTFAAMEILDIALALLTLIALEVVLGIDNIIFIGILSDKLPEGQRDKLRKWGIGLAMGMRLALLTVISWVMKLDSDVITVWGKGFSGKELILLGGGVFLLHKSTREIFHMTEKSYADAKKNTGKHTFGALLAQVLVLDVVFSLDSVITAVGMVDQLWVMYVAVVVTVVIMLVASRPIIDFITKHPSFKVLALSFLMVIGVALVAEGMGHYLPKGYIYGPMAFAFLVDMLQMRVLRNKQA